MIGQKRKEEKAEKQKKIEENRKKENRIENKNFRKGVKEFSGEAIIGGLEQMLKKENSKDFSLVVSLDGAVWGARSMGQLLVLHHLL